jgi:hypothetical protein
MQIINGYEDYEDEMRPLEWTRRVLTHVAVLAEHGRNYPRAIGRLARQCENDLADLRVQDLDFWQRVTQVFDAVRQGVEAGGDVPDFIERDLTRMLQTFGERIRDVTTRDFEAAIRTKHLAARLDRIATAYEAAMGEGRLVEAVEARWRQDGR